MGKKVKKDEKTAPDDVFDPLLVESKQAGTVVLMLNSPEEDVLAKACEAIYRFVDKCDDNKKLLLDLGAVDSLLRLIQHEDRMVRRNACMSFGVMSAHPEVRRALRKKEETVPAIVALLQPEEDAIIHEFAALCLSNLSIEYSSKVAIFEQNGIEPLVRCLSASDPDVQKNAIESLAQLMLDYQARAAVRDFDGFQPMLELLKSEYAIIQKLSLLSLDRATQDAENRSCMRELDAIAKLVEFVGHPEWNDLHVMAVMVLSNLLEDLESLEQVKETGGLKKLVALITDQSPPEDESNKKPEKKGGSRAGKKSAKESKAAKDEDKEPAPGEAIIPTLPDVKMCAAKAIARSARNAENRKMLHEQEAEKMLIHLLTHEDPNVQTAAAQGLAIMSENFLSRDSIRDWEGMQPLIKLLNNDNGDVREAATLALANLTTGNLNNCQEISNLNGVDPLIQALSDQREMANANAACVLTNMATDEFLRTEIQNKAIVPALIGPLKSNNKLVQSKAALASAAFVCDADSRAEFRNVGGLEQLVLLLHSGNDEVRRNACWAITVCGVDEPTATEISQLGGLEILQEIQLSSTRRNVFGDAALDRLLDTNLSAKYSLVGRLESTNIISDGFFDAGQMKSGCKFLALEDYFHQELNDKRAILLVNAKLDPSAKNSQTKDIDIKHDSSRGSISGKTSRTGRESRAKSKMQREKEEKQREVEIAAQLQKEAEDNATDDDRPFSAPSDPALVKYVEEVMEKIQPLSTTREQVAMLAQFVSEKMGGTIDRGQVASFCWELPLSQLKYELKSNIVPIGRVKAGILLHRALLFKALADRIAVNVSLQRGEYNRAWNEVMLLDTEESTPGDPKFPPKLYIVDLVHVPGDLMRADSSEAVSYQRL